MGRKKKTKKEVEQLEELCKEDEELMDLISFEDNPDLSNVIKTFDFSREGGEE